MLLYHTVIFQDAPGGHLQAVPLAPRVPLFRVLRAKFPTGQLSGPAPSLPGTNPYLFRLKQLSARCAVGVIDMQTDARASCVEVAEPGSP